jgi:hypothetical protein
LDVRGAEISQAVALLFNQSGKSFVIKEEAHGKVTACIVDQPLEATLRAILSPLGLTWRLKDEIYEIIVKPEPPKIEHTPPQGPEPPQVEEPEDVVIEKVELDFIDAKVLAAILKGETSPSEGLPAGGLNGLQVPMTQPDNSRLLSPPVPKAIF